MIRPTLPAETQHLMELARGTKVFKPLEIDALQEVLDDYHKGNQHAGHRAVSYEQDGKVIGFAYYAPTPMTDRTWHLYWIFVDKQTQAKLKVRFAPAWLSWLPSVWGDYWIIGLAPDYSWAVVGDPGREYLWILARTPRLDAESMAAARAAAQTNGFDIGRLVQTAQEAGRP